MTSLIDKIELLIKREKTTPEKKKDDSNKSSNEILSELFSAFNADPPKIDEISVKKAKKSKKKHKKEKKKRNRSSSSSSSDGSDYSHKRRKSKKSKSKKHKSNDLSPSYHRSRSPLVKFEPETPLKLHTSQIKQELKLKELIKQEAKVGDVKDLRELINIKREDDKKEGENLIDASLIPMPESPKNSSDDPKAVDGKTLSENDKSKGKIQIKNLKFSAVFEETVKKAEEEARKRAEKYEDGEYTDSSSDSVKVVDNLQFPKSSDPGGILKKQAVEESRVSEERKLTLKKSSHKSSHKEKEKSKDRERSRSRKRSRSKSKRSRSRSTSRKRHRRSSSRTRRRSRSRRRTRSRERDRPRTRHHSPRHRRRSSRSPLGVRLADSEKKRLLEVARRNAINMLKNGAVPAGAAALPPHTRTQVMAAIQSGGKSVDELTDFCKHLSKKEALGELSSVSSHDDDMSENEDTLAFHHPFLVKEKAPIVMNIRGGAPLPIKSAIAPVANKEELRLQFPVSSGSQHREKATEWVPVSPKKDNMQVAKLNSKPAKTDSTTTEAPKSGPLALPAPPATTTPAYMKGFTSGSQLASVTTATTPLPVPGPQAYPPGIDPPKIDMALIVSQKIAMIRKEQEENEITGGHMRGFGWSADSSLGQFTGSTGANILTPRELASGTQAWAKKVFTSLLCDLERLQVINRDLVEPSVVL